MITRPERVADSAVAVRPAAPTIVVGVSDEPLSAERGLLPWVAGQARLTGFPVVVVHAWLDYQPHVAGLSEAGFTDPSVLQNAARKPAQAAVAMLQDLGTVSVPQSTQDSAAHGLSQLLQPGDLLVLGGRPGRTLRHLLSQNVSARVLRAAPCPVAVIPHDWSPGRSTQVTIGYDESIHADAALHWALRQAALLRVPVTVVRAVLDGPLTEADEHDNHLLAQRLTALATAAGVASTTLRDVSCGNGVAAALLAAADGGELVIGNGRASRWAQLAGASITDNVTRRASVPLVVVPD